jgi:peptide/nickel transport system permease protein
MVRRVTKRFAPYLLVIWAAISVSFVLPRLAPGQPLDYLLGYDASTLSEADQARVLGQYGLDRPLAEQYVAYLAGILAGDLGSSVRTGRPVADMVTGRVGWTLALALPALAIGILVGVPAGALAAWHRRRVAGVALTGSALLLTSLPAFWLGLILMAVFAAGLGWFPIITSLPLPSDGAAALLETARRLTLPVLTLSIGTAGWMLLTTRAAVEGTLGAAYLQLARANGISERAILWRHALRNALLPVVTNAGLALGALVGGVVVVESVFSVPGIGSLMYSSVLARDYPALQGAFLVTVVAVVGANLLADLAVRRLDPRVR